MPFDSIPPDLAEALLSDPKLQELPASLFKAWVNLHLIASSYGGALPSLAETAFHLRSGRKTVARQIEQLKEAGLLLEADGALIPTYRERRRLIVNERAEPALSVGKDRTAAERMRRFRARKRDAEGVTPAVTAGVTEAVTREIIVFSNQESLSPSRNNEERYGEPIDPFRQFWAAFPPRDGDNPQAPAVVAWRRALAAGGDPERIIAAARAYAAAVSGREKRFICSAARWLAEGRWRDERAVSGPSKAVEQPGVWVAHDSPQWRAWAAHWRATKGKSPPMDSKGGWRFPAPWPPAKDEGAAA